MRDLDKMRELSRLFAESCGLPIPHDKAPAGELHDASGRVVWHWFKCPEHLTWMQPCFCSGLKVECTNTEETITYNIPHWHCAVDGCWRVRTAKMRTTTERELFRLMRYLETHA